MTDHHESFKRAEQALLESEAVRAESHLVDLAGLGGTARVLIAGEGPPVLFVPGVMSGGAIFAGLVGRLPDYRCIMLDRPGTGLSPVMAAQSTDLAAQEHLADLLLAEVLDGLQVERAHVVCTSLGGWTTFRSAASHPDRFISINALAYQIGARISDAPFFMRLAAPKNMMPRRLRVSRGMVRAMLRPGGMRSAIDSGGFSDQLLDYVVALVRHTETFRNEGLYNPRPIGLAGPVDTVVHRPELLAKVTAPVHLFWGADDVFGGEASAREFAELLPHADLQMVPGAGHAPWLDEPELAAAAVRQHLTGHPL
jgi:pimeloyl-ACP methyl ester carboxylesterase